MKHSITLTESTDSDKKAEAKYLCSWNGHEIVEIHTKQTLYDDYKGSNLFEVNEDETLNAYFESIGYGLDDLLIKDYLDHSSKDDDLLGVPFFCDNMKIIRIV
tara:strand:- start:2166 stop:2474 length:309 start_codon:yes stop_codon:yes gene_type:complete